MRWRRAVRRFGLGARSSEPPYDLPKYRHRRSTHVIVGLFAVGLVAGFAVSETADHAPSPPALRSQSNSAGSTHHFATNPPTTTSSVPATTTTVPAPVPTTQTRVATQTQLAACAPADVAVRTFVASSSYPPGSTVEVTTSFEALDKPCLLYPVRTGPYSCGATIVVNGPSGNQVWPVPGQGEQCAQPTPGVLEPGASDTVTVAWDQRYTDPSSGTQAQAPPGAYQAIGKWAWSAGTGIAPYEVPAPSGQFAIG